MRIVIIYGLYLFLSAALTFVTGRTLDRSGRAFLADWFGGNDALARAVSRLLILGFYLLSLGYVVLSMRTAGNVGTAAQVMQLLSVKIGEFLLVLGALPLLILVVFARIRRRGKARAATAVAGHSVASVPSITQAAKPANAAR
jgi:hypothetical protein